MAVGHPVSHEHEHRPGYKNQPFHSGVTGESPAAACRGQCFGLGIEGEGAVGTVS